MTPILTLASNSPRRRQLLALTGWPFTVRPVDIDENPHPAEPPDRYVRRLAAGKARAAGRLGAPGEVILTADTTVADGSQILGKPEGAEEARAMLHSLKGRRHTVYTAIGALRVPDAPSPPVEPVTDLCATHVWMRDYTDEEIEAYIASGDPFDKAGGYAIQHPEFHPVARIEGCYACVVGLPVCHLIRLLQGFGFPLPERVEWICPEVASVQAALSPDTPCPALEEILKGRRDESGGRDLSQGTT
jgi:MAF protein